MPMYVNSDSVKVASVDRVYVGENLVFEKKYKYEEIEIDANNSKAGIDSGVEYKTTGPVCTLKQTHRSTIKLRITFEAVADKYNPGDVVFQETHHPDSTFTNGTWTKEFTFKKDSPAVSLITNDVSMRGTTGLSWSYNNKTDIVKLWLDYSNGLDEDNPNYPWLSSNVYIRIIKVEQYV